MIQLIVFCFVLKAAIQKGAITGIWRYLSAYFFLTALFIDGHWMVNIESVYFDLFDKEVPSWFHFLTMLANI